ncbi:hypothetical protein PM082_023056 [Marasmius tenuissimus]|nr:hypothetical protein PM082_023056 [Marasmius tenuissimus]
MITRIDERDPQLVFTPTDAWSPGGKKPEYMETTMGTTIVGARVSFNFTGTGIGVFGTISNNRQAPTVTNTYTIDGGSPVQRSQKPVLGFQPQYNAKMFSVRGLEDGAHNLVMEVMVNNSETYIDYFEVEGSTKSSASSPSGVPVSSTQQITSSATSPPAPTTSGADAGGALSPGATVAAISISGTIALTLGLLLLRWCLRNRGGGKMKERRTYMFPPTSIGWSSRSPDFSTSSRQRQSTESRSYTYTTEDYSSNSTSSSMKHEW